MTQFKVDGIKYGGTYSYEQDPRIKDFLEWVPPEALNFVLELASCEGGQTYEIQKDHRVTKMICLEGKDWLVDRSKMVFDLLKVSHTKVVFEECNLDTRIPFWLRTRHVSSVFCSGLLYHLNEPWRLIQDLHKVAKYIYIATHFTPNDRTLTRKGGYVGIEVGEPKDIPAWCGITNTAFWFTLPELLRCFQQNGLIIQCSRVWDRWSDDDPNPMLSILCHTD